MPMSQVTWVRWHMLSPESGNPVPTWTESDDKGEGTDDLPWGQRQSPTPRRLPCARHCAGHMIHQWTCTVTRSSARKGVPVPSAPIPTMPLCTWLAEQCWPGLPHRAQGQQALRPVLGQPMCRLRASSRLSSGGRRGSAPCTLDALSCPWRPSSQASTGLDPRAHS